MKFLIIQLALVAFATSAWSSSSVSVVDAIKKAALREYETGLTTQQQEESKWVAEYFDALPSDVNRWQEFEFNDQGAPDDLKDIEAAFVLAYNRKYFEQRSDNVDNAIIKYSSPIFWRVREIANVAPNLSAALSFHYVDTISSLDGIEDLDLELVTQVIEATLLNYQNVDSQLVLAIIDTHLEINGGELGTISKRIIREYFLTNPSIFQHMVLSAYSKLKESNEGDGLSILSIHDIDILESAFGSPNEADVTYVYKVLDRSVLSQALRPEDWDGYPNFDTFFVKHFAGSK